MENKAGFLLSPNTMLEIKSAPLTHPTENEILIRNHAIAVNPLERAQQDTGALISSYPYIMGLDNVGNIVEVGSAVTNFNEGDRVVALAAGVVRGNPTHGGFQLYTVILERYAVCIPDSVPFTNAVVLPVALATAASGLFESIYLAILVWGGSSSVGSCAIQLAKAAGLTVFATASAKNFEYVKDLRVSQVFDYNEPYVVARVSKRTHTAALPSLVEAAHGKNVVGGYDVISSHATTLACGQFLQAVGGGKIFCTRPDYTPLELQEGVTKAQGQPQHAADDGGPPIWHRVWADFMGEGLETGKLRPKPEPVVLEGGLERLQEGVDMVRKDVSAQKVVVEVTG
ncbi:oxidoreductase [Lentithecium fluviatile CBS 122367]|uniref:Oxidoreductase n=1 Tax=Lentithecium fluviatile CBS 122367 TaxID=1168545 RepID=A0A6G1IJY9_9PLEO|nr:oxidoreductase [Lentithecium fluviatile CBS 122367]